MNITLVKENYHWIMELHSEGLVAERTVDNWGAAVDSVTEELKDRQGVKRMSYNTWHWDGRREIEAREYITYFYLKHS
jgi:hypothetical protein